MTIDTGLLDDLDELFPIGGQGADGPGGAVAPVLPLEMLLTPDNPALRTRGILKRRAAPIAGYCGLNGSGKSMQAVRDSLLSLATGRRLLSTVTILDAESGNPHPGFELFTSWRQFHDIRNTDIISDEITGIMDSRDSGMPKHVRKMLPQMRRENVRFSWTGINWDNTDRRLRQLTWFMVACSAHAPDRRIQRMDGAPAIANIWAPNRLFVVTTFDATRMTKSEDSDRLTEDDNKRRRAKVINREYVWGPRERPAWTRGFPARLHPGALAFASYNTLDAVAQVDNSCPDCGGKITEKICKGHDAPVARSTRFAR